MNSRKGSFGYGSDHSGSLRGGRKISYIYERLLASQKELCSRQLIRMRNHNELNVLFYTVTDLVTTVCSQVHFITVLLPEM